MNVFLFKIKAWIHWTVVESYPLWLVIAVPLLALPVGMLRGLDGLKAYAVTLQIVGAAMALWVIRDNLRLFDAGGIRAAIRAWWARRPGTNGLAEITGVVAVGEAGDTFAASVTVGPMPPDSVEVQLAGLWAGLANIQSALDSLRQESALLHSKTQLDIQGLQALNDSRNSELQSLIRKVAASSPFKAYFGAWMAAVGTVLSTYTPEIAGAL